MKLCKGQQVEIIACAGNNPKHIGQRGHIFDMTPNRRLFLITRSIGLGAHHGVCGATKVRPL